MRGGLVDPAGAAPEPWAAPVPIPTARRHRPAPVARGARPSVLLYVVLGAILTDVWRLHDLVPATQALRPSIALTVLGFVLLAAGRGGISRALHRLRSRVALWFALLAGLMLVGLPVSLDPAQSAEFLQSAVLPHAMVGLLVAASVRDVRDVEFLALGTLGGGFVHTVFAHATVPLDAEGRWAALPHYDVNDLALMFVVMIPLTLYFMRRENTTPRRVFAAACFALFAYSMVLTGSRGGFVGFAVVLAYLLLRYKAVPARARLVGALAAVLALAVGGQAYLSRLGTIFRPTQDYNWSEETGRLAIWQRGIERIGRRPLTGVGVNQFRTAESREWALARQARMTGRRWPPARGAHNMFIQVGAEIGLPGLLAFVALLGSAWRTLTRVRDAYNDGSAGPALSGALAASLVGFCVCGMFLHAAFFPVLPMLLGLTMALADICGTRAPALRPRRGGLFAYGETPHRVPA